MPTLGCCFILWHNSAAERLLKCRSWHGRQLGRLWSWTWTWWCRWLRTDPCSWSFRTSSPGRCNWCNWCSWCWGRFWGWRRSLGCGRFGSWWLWSCFGWWFGSCFRGLSRRWIHWRCRRSFRTFFHGNHWLWSGNRCLGTGYLLLRSFWGRYLRRGCHFRRCLRGSCLGGSCLWWCRGGFGLGLGRRPCFRGRLGHGGGGRTPGRRSAGRCRWRAEIWRDHVSVSQLIRSCSFQPWSNFGRAMGGGSKRSLENHVDPFMDSLAVS